MSSTRITIGALFSTISETANTVTNLVGTVNKGVGMASSYVDVLVKEQELDNIARVATYQEKLIERLSMEEAERQLDIIKFTEKSNNHKELYIKAQDRYTALFAPKNS